MTIIDVHAHWLPAELGERFTALSGRPYRMNQSRDQSQRIADLEQAGVDQQVLSLGGIHPYWPERRAAADGARFANDLYAGAVDEHAGRFLAFGALPLPHPEQAVAEAVRCLDELGFTGIGLGCSADGVALDDPRFDEFWAEMDARAAVVCLHPGMANRAGVGVEDYPMLLGPAFGSPAETAIAVVRLALAGTIAKHPRVRFGAAAMGGSLLVSRTKLADSLARTADHPLLVDLRNADVDGVQAAVDSLWLDTGGIDDVLAHAARLAGAVERLVFGSDALWGSPTAVAGRLRDYFTPSEVQGVLGRGANLLLGQVCPVLGTHRPLPSQ